MKKTGKRILSVLLCAGMLISQMSTAVFAQETEEIVEETVTIEYAAEADDLPDNDELFAYFAEEQLYDYDTSILGTQNRDALNNAEKGIYDALREKIEYVALNGGSTEFTLDSVDGLKTIWTNTEEGVESLDYDAVYAEFAAQFDLGSINEALLYDCPFDLYWYNKSIKGAISNTYGISASYMTVNGEKQYISITFKNLTFKFKVAGAYQGSEYAVTTDVSKVLAAKENAQAVVDANASKTSLQKLTAYKDAICDAVSYNHTAADDDSTPYGDPWQLIYVFDGDSSTNVVCEGYTKAFQYLCDLGGVDCFSTSGVMTGATGSGRHMWNVVTLGGKNYLVDVTNCDSGTVGYPDELFMVGAPYSSGKYTFDCGSTNVIFTPDDGDLNLAAEAYVEEEHAHNTDGDVLYSYSSDTYHNILTLCKDCPENYAQITGTEVHSTGAQGDLPATATDPAYCSVCASYYGEALASAISGTLDTIEGGTLTWKLTSDGTLTISGNGTMVDQVGSYEDSNAPWREYLADIKSIVIAEGVTGIGDCAFYNCSAAETVSLPSTLTETGMFSFYNCSALKSVVIPESVTELKPGLFKGCSALVSAEIPETVTAIWSCAFDSCSSLESVELPAGLTVLDECAFYGCSSLKEVVIPDGITAIADQVFEGCYALESVTLPANITSLGYGAFTACVSLTSIDIPETVTSIGERAFFNCSVLENVTLPAGLTSLGDSAFTQCAAFTEIVIPDGVTSIADYTFSECTKLASVTLPANLTFIGERAFYKTALTSVELPDTVTEIGDSAFRSSALTSITLPAGIQTLPNLAFGDCSALTEIVFEGNAPEIVDNAFRSVTADAYYPANDATWTENVLQNYGGTLTWIASGADVVVEEVIGDIAYEVEGSVVTVSHTSACKLGYFDAESGSYVAVEAAANADGSYSYTVPEGAQGVVLVVKGDVNADGELLSGDYSRLNAHLLGKRALTGAALFAADCNGDGEVLSGDYSRLNAVLLGKTSMNW